MVRVLAAFCLALVALPAQLSAEPPRAAELTRHGFAPGTQRKVTLHGQNLKGAMIVHNDLCLVRVHVVQGYPGTDPSRVELEVDVPAETPLGFYAFRVSNQEGISNPIGLMVDDLPTVLKDGAHTTPAKAQPVKTPSAIEGAVTADQADCFRIHATAGQLLSVEAVARRIGSPLDPLIRLLDARGNELAYSDDDESLGADARFAHRFKEEGDYVIEIRDSRYSGNGAFRYRLRIGDFPLVSSCYPLAGIQGKKTLVDIIGPEVSDVAPLELQMPPTGAGEQWLQRAARRAGGQSSGIFRTFKSSYREIVEVEPNNTPDNAQRVAYGTGVSGRFQAARDRDQYRFTVAEQAPIEIHANTRSFGTPTNLVLRLIDPNGKEIARGDEVAGGDPDYLIAIRAPKSGDYRLVVDELTGRGGAEFAYRVMIGPVKRSFDLTTEKSVFQISADGLIAVPVTVKRKYGFQGPIKFVLAGSVAGWRVLDGIPEGKDSATIRIEPKQNEPTLFAHSFYLIGNAQVDGGKSQWGVTQRAAVQQEMRKLDNPPDELLHGLYYVVGPALPPMVELNVESKTVLVEPLGKPTQLKVTAKRKAGFDGAIELRARNLPNEFELKKAKIDKGKDSATIEIKLVEDTTRDSLAFEVVGLYEHQGRARKVVLNDLQIELKRPK
ncbi:MAG: PPC domain-containing protein [Planctomycetes bacterium]|nr:PPC domain-containing protein [Planctomycetota bacterium]